MHETERVKQQVLEAGFSCLLCGACCSGPDNDGCTFTFGWVLRRGEDGNCIFLENNRCRVYQNRPHICRTYPFMLDGEELIVSECPGCSKERVTEDAGQITKDLLRRRDAEDRELEKTEKQYQKHSISTGSTIVFDSNGAHEYSPTRKNHD